MKKKSLLIAIGFVFVLFCSSNVQAQTNEPYTEGPVWLVNYVQTKPGMYDRYLKDLSTHWVKMMREAKKEGIIMDFKLLTANRTSETDWDLMMLVEIKNYAVLDGIDKRFEAIAQKVLGSEDTQHQKVLSRADMRIEIGRKLSQELIFK
jgi:hypothetical protein